MSKTMEHVEVKYVCFEGKRCSETNNIVLCIHVVLILCKLYIYFVLN